MGGVVSVNDPMVTTEQLDEFERRLKAKHGGNDRAGELFVTKGDVTVSPLQWPEKELQSIAKQDFYEKRIRAAFGHTESMADSNASTYASALVGYDHQYMGSAIRPRLLMDAAQKTEFLCDLFGLDPTVYMFVYDDPVVKDEAALRDQTRQDVAAGIITINEARSPSVASTRATTRARRHFGSTVRSSKHSTRSRHRSEVAWIFQASFDQPTQEPQP